MEEKVAKHMAFSGGLTGQGEASVYHLSVPCRSQYSLQDSISLRAHLKWMSTRPREMPVKSLRKAQVWKLQGTSPISPRTLTSTQQVTRPLPWTRLSCKARDNPQEPKGSGCLAFVFYVEQPTTKITFFNPSPPHPSTLINLFIFNFFLFF